MVIAPFPAKGLLFGPGHADNFQRLGKAGAGFGGVDIVGDVFVRRAAHQASNHPPAGQGIQHGEFLGHPKRIEDRNIGAEQRDLGVLDHLRKGAGHDHRIGVEGKRRKMMLGHRHPVEAHLIGKGELLQRCLHGTLGHFGGIFSRRHRPALGRRPHIAAGTKQRRFHFFRPP